MRIGIHTAQVGRLASAAAVRAAAQAAETIGYSSLWVVDRLPIAAASGKGAPPPGALVEPGRPPAGAPRGALDPVVTLAVAAGATTRVRLGTSVLVAPWYPPVLLARSLTSLDVVSDGRLTVGLGLGSSDHELEAVGVDRRGRGRRLEEALDVLDALWDDGPVDVGGPSTPFAPAADQLRPVQQPRPPVLLSASTPAGLDRVARRADGWNPVGIAPAAIAPAWQGILRAADGYGRDPATLQLVVRADIDLTDRPVDGERGTYHGSVDQVADDLDATAEVGAHEVILVVRGDRSLDELLDAYARLAEAADLRAGVTVG
jgi:probable F420-dependent oxidoreductase